MSIEFRDVSFGPLTNFSAVAPTGAIIGVLGEKGSGVAELLRLAAGTEKPASGEIVVGESRRLVSLGDTLNLAPADVLALDQALATQDPMVRARTVVAIDRLRRSGATILLSSYEDALLSGLCDEIWWIDGGKLALKGDPRETLERYRRNVAERIRAWGGTLTPRLTPSMRRGDGRAEVLNIETLGADGNPTIVWKSGEEVAIQVAVQFLEAVEKPVFGILIRTRIGFEVYGTNTDLEKVELGPRAPGDVVRVKFSFVCRLCPNEYTITVASHDPDGTAHDWLDDAIAVSVTDARPTAGVANLHASVTIE
ncbi:MAG: Wzt carbohydrate-binding domain-containing protein [Bryobacteraceae bacterium]